MKNHGTWSLYQPKSSDWPIWAAFARRDEDGKDWYDYIYKENNFEKDSVKMTVMFMTDKWVVMAAVRNPDEIFPAGKMVLEVESFDGNDPQKYFGRRIYNPDTEEFGDLAWEYN